jgi:hypothetical protein
MTLANLAAILDPGAPDSRDFIIQLSPEADEELRSPGGRRASASPASRAAS